MTRKDQGFIHNVINAVPSALIVIDRKILLKSNQVTTNHSFEKLFGKQVQKTVSEVLKRIGLSEDICNSIKKGKLIDNRPVKCQAQNGSLLSMTLTVRPILDSSKQLVILNDYTLFKQTTDALITEQERAQVTLNAINDAVITIDTAKRVLFMNPVAETMTGQLQNRANGILLQDVLKLTHQEQDSRQTVPFLLDLEQKHDGHFHLACLVLPNGEQVQVEVSLTPIVNKDNNIDGWVVVCRDVTELKGLLEKVTHQANHDDLTGLVNRYLFTQKTRLQLKQAKRNATQFAIVFIDLDRFKSINDSLGHKAGDELLIEVSKRLEKSMRAGDVASRLSGDEFALLINNIQNENHTVSIIQRLLDSIGEPLTVGGRTMSISCSFGLSFYPADGDNAESLLKNADTAMYRAKEVEGRSFQFFEPAMQEQINQRISMEDSLKQAIVNDQFFLVYQPKTDILTGSIIGVEALIRWQHPQYGLVSPEAFIKLAEEIGLIIPIGEIVLDKACAQLRKWIDIGLNSIQIAVNLSAIQLMSDDIEAKIKGLINQYKLPPKSIELEITESMSMDDPEKSIQLMDKFSEMGISIAIDDFGTGYSNLAYLQRFQANLLKIDMAFIQDIITSPQSLSIVRTIIGIGHSLNMKVIAEGVETQEQLHLLQKNNCDLVQGYFVSKPLLAADFIIFYKNFKFANFTKVKIEPEIKILVIDDEKPVISSIIRSLKRLNVPILSAETFENAFSILAKSEIGLIICDQNIAMKKGTDFLADVKRMYPDIIRFLITGATDFETVYEAINSGEVHHFVTKPWDNDLLFNQAREAVKKYLAIKQIKN